MIEIILITVVFVTCFGFCMYLSDDNENLKEKLRKSNETIGDHERLLDKISDILDHRGRVLIDIDEKVDVLCKVNGLVSKDRLIKSEREIFGA